MDVDELTGLFGPGHERTLVHRLSGLTEAQRKKLAPAVRGVVRDRYIGDANRSVLLAALGTLGGARQVANALSFSWRPQDPADLAVRVLRDRDPHWLPRLPEALLGEASNWPLVRALVREGLVGRPDQPEYLVFMVNGVRSTMHVDSTETIRECLERDPGLLDTEVWDLLALELAGRRLAMIDGWLERPWGPRGENRDATRLDLPERTWRVALAGLASDGRIDRARLVDTVLAAPLHDWSPTDLAWFVRLHDELAPTAADVVDRQATYARLLTVEHGPSVKLAQKALTSVLDDERLEVPALLEASRATLTRPDKASVAAQLRLLAGVHRQHPGAEVAGVVRIALDHPRADVRERAAQLLAKVAPDAVVTDEVAVAPMADLAFSRPVPRPRPALEPVVPVADADELADLFLRLVEEADDPIEVERLLDGVLRLARERPAGADVLLRRVTQGEFWTHELRAVLASLAVTWLDPRSKAGRTTERMHIAPIGWQAGPPPQSTVYDAATGRFRAVARAVRGGGAPSVALPSYSDGSIEPADLSARLARLGRRDHPTPEDVALAVLRVPPDRLHGVVTGKGWSARVAALAMEQVQLRRPRWERVTGQVTDRWSRGTQLVVGFRDPASPSSSAGPVDCLLNRADALADARELLDIGTYESRFEQTLALCAVQLPHHPDHLASHVQLVQLRDRDKDRGVTAVLMDAIARTAVVPGAPASSSLVLGLAAKDARVRTSAQDALLDLAAFGLLDGAEVGRQTAAHLADDLVVGSRVAAGLAETARADDAAVLPVLDALARLLPVLPGRRDAGAFLELTADLVERTGRRVELPEELRSLAAGKSTSMTAKAVRRLI